MASFCHELLQCVCSNRSLLQNNNHKLFNENVFSHHVLQLCVWRCNLLFSAKEKSQILHSNGFFPSWTESLCTFMWCFIENIASQRLHWKGFFPSWTAAMFFFSYRSLLQNNNHKLCNEKAFFLENLTSQILHL